MCARILISTLQSVLLFCSGETHGVDGYSTAPSSSSYGSHWYLRANHALCDSVFWRPIERLHATNVCWMYTRAVSTERHRLTGVHIRTPAAILRR